MAGGSDQGHLQVRFARRQSNTRCDAAKISIKEEHFAAEEGSLENSIILDHYI